MHLGTYCCPEAAALAIARRLRDDPILRAHVEARHAAAAQPTVLEVESVVVDAWSDDEDEGESAAIIVEAACTASTAAAQPPVLEVETVVVDGDAQNDDEDEGESAAIIVEAACTGSANAY